MSRKTGMLKARILPVSKSVRTRCNAEGKKLTDFCETNSLEEKRNALIWVITQRVVGISY
jgi:hypothetical protein